MSWLYSLIFAGLIFSSQPPPINVHRSSATERTSAAPDETERFEQSYPLAANGRVSVSNVNGSVVVNAWDKNEVKLVAVKTADSRDRLADVEIKIDARADSFSVETNYDKWKNHDNGDRWHNGKMQVDYELSVPRGAVLNEIETVNGSVTLSDFTNITKASAVNGNVKASNLRGTASLSTVNGELFADFDRLENSGKINLETVNGKVNLSIPSDSNATLRADSVNGSISNEFGLPVRKGKYVGRDLYGRIGSGEVQVRLSSVNGTLAIGHNKDGKAVSPATNLLQQKSKDDDDMDDESDKDDKDDDDSSLVVIDGAKINKDVSKAIRQGKKESAKAMKQAQKALADAQPQIDKINAEALEKASEAINSADVQASIQAGMQTAAKIQSEIAASMREIRFSGMPRVEKKGDSIPVKGTPKVTIDAPGCSVSVKGWDRSEVQYSVVRFTTNRNSERIQAHEDHSESAVNIRVDNSPKDGDDGDVPRTRIEVFVPRKSDLKVTADGPIRLQDVSGEMDINGKEESIDIRDVNGKMTVISTTGQVRVIGFAGDLDAKTDEGTVYIEGKFDRLSAEAGNGTVILTLPQDLNAAIRSNKDVVTEGLGLTKDKDDEELWHLGKGGPEYVFDFDGGHLTVRNMSEIAAK